MKLISFFTILSTSLILSCRMLEGQTFQNMDFEGQWTGTFDPPWYSYGSIPGWTALSYPYPPGLPTNNIELNTMRLDDSLVSIVNSSWVNFSWSGTSPIQGTQSIFLNSMSYGGVSISQIGQVPDGSRSLRLLARDPYGEGMFVDGQYIFPVFNPSPIVVTFAGAELSLLPLSSTPSSSSAYGPIVEYGADITPWAGMTGELSIHVVGFSESLNVALPPGEGFAEIDQIQFSPVPIPEPNPVLLFAASIVLLGLLRLEQSRHHKRAL